MGQSKGKKSTIRTNITFDVDFLRIVETLAAANGMSRDKFIEYAVRKAFDKEIAIIQAELVNKDEEQVAPRTTHLVAQPA